jgi:hypothetical protein
MAKDADLRKLTARCFNCFGFGFVENVRMMVTEPIPFHQTMLLLPLIDDWVETRFCWGH